MAITGTGTQADPWIFHSYSELQTIFNNTATFGGTTYSELANDIDCNDYGADFVWNNLSLVDNTRSHVCDLKGHTIKNIQVASNQSMFTFANSAQSVIKNGKILNVFMNGSKGLCNYTSGLYAYSKLVNVSVSANADGILGTAFYCGFDSCAIYLEGGNTSYNPFNIPSSVSAQMKNTDVLLNNAKGYMLFDGTGSQNIAESRIRGKFTGSQNYLADSGSLFNNCVVDLEYNARYLTGNGGTNTGVINTDKLPTGFNTRGMTPVNSQEIINGDSLRTKGFVVVNVSA